MKELIKSRLFVPFLLLLLSTSSIAQDFLPVLNDNYMGINQVTLQPASIVDSRFKVDVNLFGYNNDVYNTLIRFKSQGAFDFKGMATDEDWYDNNSYMESPDNKDKSAFLSQTVLCPSFLIELVPKHAIGFTYRIRNIVNVDDISEPLARSIVEDYGDPQYWDTWYHDKNLRAANHLFADYGLTYATEILNTGKNYLKSGITVKLLQGMGGMYLEANDFYYYFYEQNGNGVEADYMSWNSDYVSLGISENWNWGTKKLDGYPERFGYSFTASPSVGLDLGVVYEFRPKYKDFRYNMDGKTDIERNDLNKYFLKVGVSILDIGRLKYKKSYNSQDFATAFTPDYLARFESGNNAVPTNTHWMDIEEVKFGFPPYNTFADTVYERMQGYGITPVSGNKNTFNVKLPTALSLQVDVNVIAGLYVNLTTYTALHQGFTKTGNSHYLSTYSITPRYEHKWFGVMIPIYYNQFKQMNVGLGLRAAFFYMGFNTLFSNLGNDPYGISFYAGIKIPIWHKKPPSDIDNDGVSDLKDNCPAAPGPWEYLGCPDRDGDGVPDGDDACPDVPGLKEFLGCPDRDGDGVTDAEDNCPDVAGPKITGGCPDRDNDGVVDDQDECPDEPGPAQLNGCPDRDGDGVPDIKDNCPDLAGPVDQGGCPFIDTDGDGVKDADDSCPQQKGPPENKGCPYTDTDGDGVIDKDDRCPLTPGVPENFGCPKLKVEEEAILKTAFENLEFETGKAVIRSTSFASMDELATLLISKPTWKLRISGHTDNVGSDESNMNLSKNRAQSTAKYLTGKGVPPSQIIPEWYGESMPIADNNTPEGRQINRRVEMKLEFE